MGLFVVSECKELRNFKTDCEGFFTIFDQQYFWI